MTKANHPNITAAMDPLIRQAHEAVEPFIAQAAADATRPTYHFHPPALWQNDPNGTIYHNGYYHLFYQHNPFNVGWGPMFWGHARSRDMVQWEHLPIAIPPRPELDETGCWSGCCAIGNDGQPMILYTSIGPTREAEKTAAQFGAVGDDDLINWRPHPRNPILDQSLHGETVIRHWRDPCVFKENSTWYCVLGGHREGGNGCIALYRSPDLVNWTFIGIAYEGSEGNWECPNVFRLDDKWVVMYSPHNVARYYTGSFDLAAGRFTPHAPTNYTLDFGQAYYAPNTLVDAQGRRISFGWIRGFEQVAGWSKTWNGCTSLPRILSLRPDGRIAQRPAEQLTQLRGPHSSHRGIALTAEPTTLPDELSNTCELHMTLTRAGDRPIVATLRPTDGAHAIELTWQGATLRIGDTELPLIPDEASDTLDVRLFIDRSMIELFVNEHICFTQVLPSVATAYRLDLSGAGTAKTIDHWPLRSIW